MLLRVPCILIFKNSLDGLNLFLCFEVVSNYPVSLHISICLSLIPGYFNIPFNCLLFISRERRENVRVLEERRVKEEAHVRAVSVVQKEVPLSVLHPWDPSLWSFQLPPQVLDQKQNDRCVK